jgi:hypothetical protein
MKKVVLLAIRKICFNGMSQTLSILLILILLSKQLIKNFKNTSLNSREPPSQLSNQISQQLNFNLWECPLSSMISLSSNFSN